MRMRNCIKNMIYKSRHYKFAKIYIDIALNIYIYIFSINKNM